MDEQIKALLEGVNALKSGQEELNNTLEEKIIKMEKKIETVKEQLNEKMEEMTQRVKDLEKKLLACGKTKNENKSVPVSPVPIPASPVSVKLYTYDGKTNWKVYKIQFSIISQANPWSEGVKACQLVASLRGKTAEVLQTLTDTELLNLNSLYNSGSQTYTTGGRIFNHNFYRPLKIIMY
ncbi:uncharacterized protein TNCV_3152531 [Trichonephila clavipes]|nr:uncharacterized protein TNCV_3152531 [Trichonephila clavipes]